MLIEHVENDLRAEAAKLAKQHHRWNRGSALGHCPRQLTYQKLGVEGDPMTPRRMSILGDGIAYDLVLKDRIQRVLKYRVIDGDFLGDHSIILEGVEISYHIDMGMQLEDKRCAVVELKTASNRTFEKALAGEIDIAYLAQAWFYHYATSFPVVIFVFYRKETSHICEVVFDTEQKETIVTQRYGGDALELAIKDPMLIAEVRSPFDDAVEMQVRQTVKSVAACSDLESLPSGVRVIEQETITVQGKAKAEEQKKAYGEPTKQNGAWYYFETGRQIAGFPCSYCGFIRLCLSAELEIKDSKPVWVIGGKKAV